MNAVRRLFQQIHERSLWQLLGSYAVGAWIVLQLAEVLTSLIGLPFWFGPVVIVLLVAGLVLILLTSLIQGGLRARPATAEAPRSWLKRTFTWRNALVGAGVGVGVLVVGTAGFLAMRAAGVGPVGTLVAKGVLDPSERIILAEFENRTADPTLGETVTALLRIDLAQSPTITLLEPVQLVPVLTRMQRDPGTPLTFDVAREAAQREGLKAIITGEVLSLGGGYVVSARITSVATGESLAAARATAPGVDRLPDAIDRLSAGLRERIGESLRSIQAEPALEQVTTRSLDALRDYARAELATDAGDPGRALTLLQEAIERDSTFAMAHRKLAIVLLNQNREIERAHDALTRAYEGRDRLTERERHLAEAAYHTYVTRDRDAANSAYEAVLAKYPTDRIALNNLAIAYAQRGRQAEARRLYQRSIEQGGAPAVTFTNAIEAEFELGWIDSARVTLHRFEEQYPANPTVHQMASRLASAQFDYAGARVGLNTFRAKVVGSPLLEAQAANEMGMILLAEGRPEASLIEFRVANQLARSAGGAFPIPAWDMTEPLLRAFALIWFFEDSAGALRLLDENLTDARSAAQVPAERDHLRRASAYALAGRPDRARRILAAYENEIAERIRTTDFARVGTSLLRGAIAEAEGRTDEATAHYRQTREIAPGCELCGLPELAGAYDRAGQADSAIAIYERYVNTPMVERITFDGMNLWRAYYRLGSLYEQRGDITQAVQWYSRFLELWKDAEPPLQPRVTQVRERVARLIGPRG